MKKIISMLLVIALMITVLTVGVATTSAAETATITIYGLDGTTQVREFNVGDEFTVYTTLDVSASVSDGKVGSVQGEQTYSSDVLTLTDELSGQYGEFADSLKVFPVIGSAVMGNGSKAGKITYNATAATSANAFTFDAEHPLLIVTDYKVKAAGTGEVKNAMVNLAAADEDLTKIVFQGQVQQGKTLAGVASFTDPTPEIDHAEVRVHSLDGRTETRSYNIGDTFTVYTYLDASSVNDGTMGSVSGVQNFTSSVLQLEDTVDTDGFITDTDKVFPIMKNSAVGTVEGGSIKYSASSAEGFAFNSSASQLITTTYKVKANGRADITNRLIVLAAADDDITRIVFGGETQTGKSYDMPSSFVEGELPTDVVPTTPTSLKVTIINPDNTTAVKEFNIGDTFTVYTVLNMGGKAASIEGTQTYPTSSLKLTDEVTGEYNEISDKAAMFPILGNEVVASANGGNIKFNATRGTVDGGYAFDTATSKLIVTNYKVLKGGNATIRTSLKTLIKDDQNATKVVYNGTTQSGQSYSLPGSFTDPGNPEQPTEAAPTEVPPTEPAPTEPLTKAVVTIYGIDGTSTTKNFNVGDSFTVYTTLDASKAAANSKISNISGIQTFTKSVLEATDTVDNLFQVVDSEAMFPIFKDMGMAKIKNADGENKFNASTAQVNKGFLFDEATDVLIVTNYTVKAVGTAEIRTTINEMAGDDANLTVIISEGEIVKDGAEVGGFASFYDPALPPPTEPATEPPTEAPTEKPTDAPVPTQPVTEPPVAKANVTIYGIDGTSSTAAYNVGDTFTVYTTFEAKGMVASISGTQTFTDSILQAADAVDADSVVTDNNAMFPIMKDNAVARILAGQNQFNASVPQVNNGFVFDDDKDLLIVTKYTVKAAGDAVVRTTLKKVASADENLTRMVDNGVVQDGYQIGGIASFADPSNPEVPTEAVTEKPTTGSRYMLGDVDGDGRIRITDVSWIQRKLSRLSVPGEYNEKAADVDSDGRVRITDVSWIQRKLARMDTPYPIGQWIDE